MMGVPLSLEAPSAHLPTNVQSMRGWLLDGAIALLEAMLPNPGLEWSCVVSHQAPNPSGQNLLQDEPTRATYFQNPTICSWYVWPIRRVLRRRRRVSASKRAPR